MVVDCTSLNYVVRRHYLTMCRAMLCKRGLSRHAVSVRLYVCLSRSHILSKRINVSSKNFHHRVAEPF